MVELDLGFPEWPGVRLQGTWRSQSGVGVPSTPVPSACRCSPLGAASAQCHKNGTCVCKPGFVGYKCDRCQDNFFLTAGGTRCEECPSCYALVKEEVSPPYLPSPHTPPRVPALCWAPERPAQPWLSGLLGPLVTSRLRLPGHRADVSPAPPSRLPIAGF